LYVSLIVLLSVETEILVGPYVTAVGGTYKVPEVAVSFSGGGFRFVDKDRCLIFELMNYQ
jgi:hypothetical protein